MLQFDLANEKETIRQYRRRVRQADELNEFAIAESLSLWKSRTTSSYWQLHLASIRRTLESQIKVGALFCIGSTLTNPGRKRLSIGTIGSALSSTHANLSKIRS
jgi:hypothetical protein